MLDKLVLACRVLATALLCIVPAVAVAGTAERTLANGLKVIVKENHRSPVAVSMVWYRAGSMDEVSGTTGVAHVLEHMMFKGTQKVPRGEFSRIIAGAGGRDNAFTSRDYTAYHQQLHKSKLALALELEADRMVNLQFSEEEFAREIKVIMEERRMRTDDNPRAQLSELMMATVYAVHPYRTPVIGWMIDLENLRLADARDWYNKWYAPNNATLVVCGDVEAENVFRLAEKFFGPIPARTLPERKSQIEAQQRGIRRITLKAPAEQPYLLMAYPVPVLRDVDNDWEPYALSLLEGVLDGSAAARLPRELVRNSRIANSAGSSYDITNRGPGLFLLDGVPAEGKSAAEVETALRDQIRRLVDDGISDEELRRIKTQVIASQIFSQDSVFYQAMRIGALNSVGLPHESVDRQVKKLQEVSVAQIREVARKYLVDDNLTVGVLDPQRVAAGRTPRSGAGNGRDD